MASRSALARRLYRRRAQPSGFLPYLQANPGAQLPGGTRYNAQGVPVGVPGGAPGPYAFTPFQAPTSPPSGFYDPSLDASYGQAERGYGDLQSDIGYDAEGNPTGVQSMRALSDFTLGKQDIERRRGQGLEDIGRNYTILGNRQRQGAVTGGTSEGGALAQALARRTVNKGREDTRLNEASDRAQGDLSLRYGRTTEDYKNTLSRAGRELGFYKGDIGAAKFFQAGQAGFVPPVAPANEQVGPDNQPYQTQQFGAADLYVNPGGTAYKGVPGAPQGYKLTSRKPKTWRLTSRGYRLV
jgi:hypothetical protein